MSEDHVQVLVVGAGPAGLFAAAELARHGIGARVIERAPAPHHQARATAIQPGTLEILAQVGLVDRIRAAAMELGFARLFDAQLEPVAELAFAGSDCQWPFQCSLPQWRTEQILTERLLELGGAVEHGVEAASLKTVDGGVLARLDHADGASETVVADWVLGAGGAHSVTRESMHELLGGETYRGLALVADVRVSCGLPRDGGALIGTPQGYVLLAPLPEGRWICFVGALDERESALVENDSSSSVVGAAIERRLGDRVVLEDVAWSAPFRMHRRLVRRLADERRFLLGDAGHLSSPFGGEGLNSGMHDGHNIAWKLALELSGRARRPLLESYGPERLAADRHVLEVSDQLHELAMDGVESARTGVRPPPPSPDKQAAVVRSRLMLDVSYAGTPLVAEHLGAGAELKPVAGPGERYPDRASLNGTTHHLLLYGDADEPSLARFRGRWDGLVQVSRPTGGAQGPGQGGSGALLIRPDGYVGFRLAPADAAGLAALDSHLDSYLIPA
jgi:2-polyprenyl-6-methoxyphenol hydroxylase-like FAD-dependent oxidoreductase